MTQWFAVHTKIHQEHKSSHYLASLGFDVFFPKFYKWRSHARKKERIAAPLFPRYIFVRTDLTPNHWRAIHYARGVSEIVRQGHEPSPVPDDVIHELKAASEHGDIVPLSTLSMFQKGDRIRVEQGSLKGHEGFFEKLSSHERVSLLLELLGRNVRVTLPIDTVSAA